MAKFVVYAFCREDNTFYYIGKGSKKRAYSKRQQGVKPPRNKTKILILHSDLDEQTALKYERLLIQFYGRKDNGTGILRNMTDGGEGVTGWVPDISWRQQKSERMKGKNNPFYGKNHTQEAKDLISAKNKGQLLGERNPMYGIRLIAENNPMYGRSRPDLAEFNKQNPSARGTKWYTDGSSAVRCIEGMAPEGFWLGRPSVKKYENK